MMPRTYTRSNIIDRFFSKINKTTTCWLWKDGVGSHGYGSFFIEKTPKHKFELAHRFSYEFHNGKIPDGLFVLHKCDNKRCVNPDHLFLGKDIDNQRDCKAKDRNARGDRNGRRKLSETIVSEILNSVKGYRGEAGVLAKQYGVCRRHMSNILKRKYWMILDR